MTEFKDFESDPAIKTAGRVEVVDPAIRTARRIEGAPERSQVEKAQATSRKSDMTAAEEMETGFAREDQRRRQEDSDEVSEPTQAHSGVWSTFKSMLGIGQKRQA